MNDDSTMPFGKFQGRKMSDVPDTYLLWLYENNACHGDVKIYIVQNLDAIRSNISRTRNQFPKLNL